MSAETANAGPLCQNPRVRHGSGDHWLTSQEPRGDTNGAAVCCRLAVVLSVPFERLDLSGQVFVLKAKKLEIPSSRGGRSGRCHLSEPLGLVQIIPGPRRILHARRTDLIALVIDHTDHISPIVLSILR